MPTFAERLQALMPDMYLIEDETGDMEILLQLIGLTLDDVQQAIAGLPMLASVDRCPPDFLSWLAGLVAVSYDPLSTPDSQRRAIREAIEQYRRLGSMSGLQYDLHMLEWSGEIIETHHQVMRLGTRSQLNQQKLPGHFHNLGIYQVTDIAPTDQQLLEVLDKHHPAGTRRWTEESE